MIFEVQRLVESSSRSRNAGFTLFTGAVFQPQSPSFTGRPFIEGHSDGHVTVSKTPKSPSFTGRPFIEGARRRPRRFSASASPSFTGRPFIEGITIEGGVVVADPSPSFTGRPFIEGITIEGGVVVADPSPSFTGRPFIEGSNERERLALEWASRRPLRDGLSLRGPCPVCDRSSCRRRRPLRDGLSLRG